MTKNKYCVIMAGGIGSRFWPISRQSKPKQFLDILDTGRTFLRDTFERFQPIVPDANFLIVTNAAYKEIVLQQIPEITENQVLCEPIGRNTAPCVAYAAYRIAAADPDADMIVTPSDHLILDPEAFRRTILESVRHISRQDAMMTIGIKPASPNTGYGYIQLDKVDAVAGEIVKVKTFTEKPGLEMAKAFVESGEFLWNSGIFIWNVKTFMQALEEFLPDTNDLFKSILPHYGQPDEYEFIRQVYSECRPVSVDIGIMEKARNVYVCCGDFGWSDIGTWSSLYEHSNKDDYGNVAPANSLMYNSSNNIVMMREGRIAVIDSLNDYIVIDNGNILMICPRGNEQDIKRYVDDLKFRDSEAVI